MNIVQLDGYAANPGDINLRQWQTIPAPGGGYCSFTTYERTPPELVVERAAEADIVITNKVLMTDGVMARLPKLKYIGVLATGCNVIDMEAARRRGIVVRNVPAYSTASVAQLTFAHILNIANGVALHGRSVSEGEWGRCPDFTYTVSPQVELAGQTLGIVGFGNTGRAVASIARAFGMGVLVAPSLRDGAAARPDVPDYVAQADTMDDFFGSADIVSLHCPLTDATRHIINEKTLSMMKPTAVLINTGRGPLVDEQALAAALNSGRIAAAGLDVLEEEPPRDGSPLIGARNCCITPHIAWATLAARQRLTRMAVDNVKEFLGGLTGGLLCFLLAFFLSLPAFSAVQWYDGQHPVGYNVVGKASPVVDIALQMFRGDMETVTGMEAHSRHKAKIEIYQLDEVNAKTLKALSKMNVLTPRLMDTKDAFFLGERDGKIIIVGNNGRGTAYGILELSRKAGVSPWVWWGDVVPEKKGSLTFGSEDETLQSPSVEYRGIFINDEDWSTLQWANKTVEPELPKGAIGPKTYKRIFQLLLRLRANALWPAMHEVTKPFFTIKGNREMADSCGIVIGSSHCEPILRSNTGEWDKKKRGAYNFITNRSAVLDYWKERLVEVKGQEALFTIGMRGIHDGSMEGVKTADEKLRGLQSVIDSQRELIAKYYSKDVENVPQVFIPYKEVLQIYESGLRVPDDVTLMWCDDNYGYMTRLSDAEQQKRSGGAGVYYHLSYWGRPHDYLWLTTTQPGLVYNELRLAYDMGAKKMWIINVHDPKVAAYQLSLAMDMAWDINSVTSTTLRSHLRSWLAQQFGQRTAGRIAPAMERFYQLCGMRKPEFMGWTQTELDKKKYPRGNSLPKDTEFSETEFGGELERYLEDYDSICAIVDSEGREDDAYFAHVTYPVHCAAAMAHKHLEAQLGDTVTAMAYQEKIKRLTSRYNSLGGGKWKGLMSAAPRGLPVFADYATTDSTTLRRCKSRPLTKAALDGCIVRNACTYDSSTGNVRPVEMLGHSMKAVSIAKGASLRFDFYTEREGKAVLRTAMIPTQANDRGDIRYAVSIDGGAPTVYSLKEPYRSERWKTNVLRGQALRTLDVELTQGGHTITVTALDDHIIMDQWMIDFRKERQFYVFPVRAE